MSQVGVVVPILNGFEDAIVALSRIKSAKHNWQPYIGKQWEDNKPISEVWNKQSYTAFAEGCKYILIINDDSWLFPNTLDLLVSHMQQTQTLLVSGTNSHKDEFELLNSGNKAGLDFSCFLIRSETFERCGKFDENFHPAYFEDNDYHYRMKLLGYDAYGLADALFYHKDNGSGTLHRMKEADAIEFSNNFERSREYFITKWGGMPDTEGLFVTPYNEGGSVKEWRKLDGS